MSKVIRWLFPILNQRDLLLAKVEFLERDRSFHVGAGLSAAARVFELQDELATMTLRAVSAEAKLNGMQKPVPLEPTTIKVGTAADVRRIVEQQNFRDEQENSDGIR